MAELKSKEKVKFVDDPEVIRLDHGTRLEAEQENNGFNAKLEDGADINRDVMMGSACGNSDPEASIIRQLHDIVEEAASKKGTASRLKIPKKFQMVGTPNSHTVHKYTPSPGSNRSSGSCPKRLHGGERARVLRFSRPL